MRISKKYLGIVRQILLPNMSSSTVPAFLSKLWTLVEDPRVDDLICWDETGNSFHVHDQGRFAKEILPHYFKHSNIASFIRQLNMYGFRKVSRIEHGGIKDDSDDLEFQHQFFRRGQEFLLERIKRKIAGGAGHIKTEPYQEYQQEEISKVITDVQVMKERQDSVNTKLMSMKRENELLWREVASLRQKHSKQQQIVNKLIQFLIHLVGGRSGIGVNLNRKRPLMLSDPSQVIPNKVKKYNKAEIPVYSVQSPESANGSETGPVISELIDPDMMNVASPKKSNEQANTNTGNIIYTASPLDPNNFKLDSSFSSSTSNNDWKLPTDLLASDIDIGDVKDLPSELTVTSATQSIPSYSGNSVADTNYLSGLFSTDSNSNSDKSLQQKVKPPFSRQQSISELNDHVDSVQYDLEGLKDILTNSQYNLDPEFLLGLFNSDQTKTEPDNIINIVDPENFKGEENNTIQGKDLTASGNELVEYKPLEVLPDLFDLADLTKEEETGLDHSLIGLSDHHIPSDDLD